MTDDRVTGDSELARTTSVEFARYFRHLADRVDKAARSVTRGAVLDQAVSVRQLDRPPGAAPDGQSEPLHRGARRRDRLHPPSRARVHRPDSLSPRRGACAVSSGHRAGRADAFIAGRIGVSHPRCRPAAHPDTPGALSGLRGSFEQPRRPDELPGAGAAVEHERAARLVSAGAAASR